MASTLKAVEPEMRSKVSLISPGCVDVAERF